MTEQTSPQVQQTKTEQISLWLTESFNIFKAQPGIFILFLLIEVIISFVLAYIPVVGTLSTFLLSPLFFTGWLLALKKREQGTEIEINDLFLGFKSDFFLPVIFVTLATILVMVGIAAPILVAGFLMGLTKMLSSSTPDINLPLVFIFLALLLIDYCFYIMIAAFSVQLVVLDKVETFTALKLSIKACLENVWPLTIYGLITIGLGVACILTLGLGFLILYPVLRIFNYILYKGIFKNVTPTQI